MGLYHNVYLVFGARITKNEMNPNLYQAVDDAYSQTGIEIFRLDDDQFLVAKSEEIESNEFMVVGGLPTNEETATKLRQFADRLDVEIEDPGWFVLHDYS